MADLRNPEKDDYHDDSAAPPTSSTSCSGPELEKTERTPAHSSHSSEDDSIEVDQGYLSRRQSAVSQRRDTELISVPEFTNTVSGPELTCTITRASVLTSASRPSSFEVDFEPDDPDDPHNWPVWYRAMLLGFVSYSTWATVLYSTSYTSGMPGMMKEFNEPSTTYATLGVTTYMIGLSIGSLLLAPVSEIYGRQPVYMVSLFFFCLTTVPCGLSKNFAQLLGVRFLR